MGFELVEEKHMGTTLIHSTKEEKKLSGPRYFLELDELGRKTDWEAYHVEVDKLIRERLRNLDPEFLSKIEQTDKAFNALYYYS